MPLPFLRGLFFVLFFSVLCQGAAWAEMVAVNGEDVNMRSGPGMRYGVVWQMGSGFPLEVIKRSGEWLRVRDFEGSAGWVKKNMVSTSPHMIVKANKGTGESVNVRSEPNTQADVVARARYGVVFQTLDKKNGWVRVRHSRGPVGWVDERLLWGF